MSRNFRAGALISFSVFAAAAFVSCGGDTSNDALTNGLNPNAQAANPNSVMVTIPSGAPGLGSAAFGTNPLVISAGSTVTWMNTDTVAHTSTSDNGMWDTGQIQPNAQSSPVPFPSPGTFSYHCSNHPTMTGVIQVTEASPTPSESPSSGPSAGPNVNPAATPSETPSVTPEASPSESPTPGPSVAATPSATPAVTSTPTQPPVQQKS